MRPDDIHVLNYDAGRNDGAPTYRREIQTDPLPGGNWPWDRTPYKMAVRYSGTRSELERALCTLDKSVRADSRVLIHTNNHGSRVAAQSTLLEFNPNPLENIHITAQQFAEFVRRCIPPVASIDVVMEQCFAGGFIGPLLSASKARQTTVATACTSLRGSEGAIGAQFDPFARDWISAWGGGGWPLSAPG